MSNEYFEGISYQNLGEILDKAKRLMLSVCGSHAAFSITVPLSSGEESQLKILLENLGQEKAESLGLQKLSSFTIIDGKYAQDLPELMFIAVYFLMNTTLVIKLIKSRLNPEELSIISLSLFKITRILSAFRHIHYGSEHRRTATDFPLKFQTPSIASEENRADNADIFKKNEHSFGYLCTLIGIKYDIFYKLILILNQPENYTLINNFAWTTTTGLKTDLSRTLLVKALSTINMIGLMLIPPSEP